MHRSRLTGALFDVPAEDFGAEVAFWSGALGYPSVPDDDDPDYVRLDGLFSGLEILVQRLGPGAPARMHFDLESDDVEAEVERLENMGASRVRAMESWWIMRDPAGLLFCVVEVQSPEEFAAEATTWDDEAL
jgi:predicted enzyme related to lactoylglutathione lyase